jgi:death-on-curing protein
MNKFITYLDIHDIEELSYDLAQALLLFDQPIPEFKTRYDGRLESALHSPQLSIAGNEIYPTIEEKTAVLFYEMNKMHPFMNGNKRIACTTMFTFLLLNGKWIETSWENLYETARNVANQSPENRKETLKHLLEFVQGNIRDIDFELKSPNDIPWPK